MTHARFPLAVLWMLLAVGGCPRAKGPATAVEPDPALLQLARARTVPGTLRSRFHFKVVAEALDISGSTGGVLILDRPGRGHVAVMGPLGPLAKVQTEGTGLAVLIQRGRQHLVSDAASDALAALSEGLLDLDDVLGLLVGALPLQEVAVRTQERLEDGDLKLVLAGPQNVALDLIIDDPSGTPVALELRNAEGTALLTATYAPFELWEEGAAMMPTETRLEVPSIGLELDVRYKSWKLLDEVPEVFGLEAPEGFTSAPLPTNLLQASPQAPE